jgi:hypothetical protein
MDETVISAKLQERRQQERAEREAAIRRDLQCDERLVAAMRRSAS